VEKATAVARGRGSRVGVDPVAQRNLNDPHP